MSEDFKLGRDFSECVSRVNPDTPQRLLALLSDATAGDDELSAAVRLLFANPVYASLFLRRQPLSVAELASLSGISARCLSPVLAARVDAFVSGYFGSSTANQVPSDLNYKRDNQGVSGVYAPSFPSSARPSSASNSEEATLFVEDDSFEVEASEVPVAKAGEKPVETKKVNVPLKPIVFACAFVLLIFASFKVPAICEPFGLCEKKDKTNRDSKAEPELKQEQGSPSLSEQESSPDPVPLDKAMPSPATAPEAAPQRPQVPLRNRPPAPAPPRESAPVREQPLW